MRRPVRSAGPRPVIGWREWLGLPDLGVRAIKAKVDTGARTSSIHAYEIAPFRRGGARWVRFEIHPRQRTARSAVTAEAEVVDERRVRTSSGHLEQRLVIVADVTCLGQRWPVEITLARRDEMGFRMLLGRHAIRGRFVVDPARSYVGGNVPPRRAKARAKRGGKP